MLHHHNMYLMYLYPLPFLNSFLHYLSPSVTNVRAVAGDRRMTKEQQSMTSPNLPPTTSVEGVLSIYCFRFGGVSEIATQIRSRRRTIDLGPSISNGGSITGFIKGKLLFGIVVQVLLEIPMFGGAVSATFPLRLEDVSNMFVDPTRDGSLIFDLLELKHVVEDNGSGTWFLQDLAREEGAEGNIAISNARQGREAQNLVNVCFIIS
ncbi:unnamed protein product [Lactuca saligna]|uniref:Uncharacterized protein n=1 Tax=Lactuca saligna TaxID=75948 RepID=A0AA35YE26_LACSI|nr:unnamed protein product [Lactuca saligna]